MTALRWLLLLPLGIALTLALLWFISELIQTSPSPIASDSQVISLSFLDKPAKEDEQIEEEEVEEVVEDSPPEEVFIPEMSLALPNLNPAPADFDAPIISLSPDLSTPLATAGLQVDSNKSTTSDRELMAVRENALSYPQMARRKRIEGWVTFNYLVSEEGKVSDVEIVESQPPRVFDRVVIKEVSKWKYLPRLENGQAVATRVTERKYVFEL